MKIGFVSDSLGTLPFEAMLDQAVALGVSGVEVNTGGWSQAPHVDLARLRQSPAARKAFLQAFESRGLEIIALNVNGNPLHPVDSKQSEDLQETIRLAGDLGIGKICTMSGLPEGREGDLLPNWVVSSWPPEGQVAKAWQLTARLLPYWEKILRMAPACGVTRFALELHGGQWAYNVPNFLCLREALGPMIGANLDPSHLFWMGADPLAAIDALGEAISHVHAKDAGFNAPKQAVTSSLENGPLGLPSDRAWSYLTLGYGHDTLWWRQFCYRLRMVGYDGWLSIEHEDPLLSPVEGLEKSVALLREVMPVALGGFVQNEI
ncbi:sugar phosphate isomerase/epimerase family protein [Asaia lannensis]|uniref:Sugar phosphate isomerase/epimerase n=1 Tax=Asaia lannensis NBRC 102526 TaxID=1307926 RepID=A0ABT1CIP7_9PROT|nr:sugar phosphate isomerase/epimerase [Asaia lannensis]MCO6160737.1 sugar phosphate isomerase/epimerase [Asaia lannensis NBRC 102526]GBQ94386.1 sugar phosphate isomerase/epimerase [Asaia lannensis NBRC 102526]